MSKQDAAATSAPRGSASPAAATAREWTRIEARLQARLAAVADEIRSYPAPITGCDAQFNYLLEQRSRIPSELARLRAARAAARSGDGARAALDAFVASCPYLRAAPGEGASGE